jgi:probable rRNA maturation factor
VPASVRLELSYAARAPWVPARRQFQRWVDAAGAARGKAAVARPPVVRDPVARDPVVSIRVVGLARSRSLNRHYRDKDRPTNVLSFAGPGRVSGQDWPGQDWPGQEWLLGELVICAPVVAAEARLQQKNIDAHWAHMTVHGVLHLLGFDHEVAAQAVKMEAREVQILDRLGFSDPYA